MLIYYSLMFHVGFCDLEFNKTFSRRIVDLLFVNGPLCDREEYVCPTMCGQKMLQGSRTKGHTFICEGLTLLEITIFMEYVEKLKQTDEEFNDDNYSFEFKFSPHEKEECEQFEEKYNEIILK